MNRPARGCWVTYIIFVITLLFCFPTTTREVTPPDNGYCTEAFTVLLMQMEAGDYIAKYAPTSKLDPGYVVLMCLEHNVDICFALAQGHLESHFGTTGKAVKTNNVWHVGQKKYEHPDSSLIPYLSVLNSVYLVDGKTEMHMLASFTTPTGRRYAEFSEYEDRLATMYWKVRAETILYERQQTFINFKQKTEYAKAKKVRRGVNKETEHLHENHRQP